MGDTRLERVAEAICMADRRFLMKRGGYRPTWQELLLQTGAEGRMRADEYRAMAHEAIAAADGSGTLAPQSGGE